MNWATNLALLKRFRLYALRKRCSYQLVSKEPQQVAARNARKHRGAQPVVDAEGLKQPSRVRARISVKCHTAWARAAAIAT